MKINTISVRQQTVAAKQLDESKRREDLTADTASVSKLQRAVALTIVIAPMILTSPVQAACTTPKDPYLNPFNKNSAHHRPIGTGALYAAGNHPSTSSWLRNSSRTININAGAPWGVSVTSTDAADPLRTIGAANLKCGSVQGLPKTIRLPKEGFPTTVKVNSNGCTDGVVVIYDKAQKVPHQIRQYNWNGGRPVGGQYKTWSISGLGHGTRPGDRVGTSASGVAALFGVLRGDEINNPSKKVEHALQMALPRSPGHCANMLSRQVVLPAVSGDSSMFNSGNNLGNIPYGALMALPPTSKGGPSIDGLGLNARGKRLAEAVRDYGIYAVDGADCNAIRADQYVANTSELKAALSKLYPYIRMVLNNNVLGTPTAGGGSGLAANCANDAG
ncbi:MAG: hypothetical protein IPK78_12675 [Rhodospirillales bacterium]|nr:hypothetical protein [Rhodospirillales bacterium]